MKVYIQNGIYSLKDIREHYNTFQNGGFKKSYTAPEYKNSYTQYGFLNYIGATDPTGNKQGNAKR